MMVFGGLLVVGALILLLMFPPGAAPAPTPTRPLAQAEIPDDGVPRVSVGDAKTAYDLNQAVFVDVRDAVFYRESRIAGAVSIPLSELESRLNELDREDWIITYCT
jgi:hypothetical protein